MADIGNAKILIIATHGFEQSELEVPRDQLRAKGATVHVATLDGEAATKSPRSSAWARAFEAVGNGSSPSGAEAAVDASVVIDPDRGDAATPPVPDEPDRPGRARASRPPPSRPCPSLRRPGSSTTAPKPPPAAR